MSTDQVKLSHLESDVELVRIVDGDHPLVSSLILKVEVQLDREDKNGDLPVQDRGRGQPRSGTHCGCFLHPPDQKFSAHVLNSTLQGLVTPSPPSRPTTHFPAFLSFTSRLLLAVSTAAAAAYAQKERFPTSTSLKPRSSFFN